MSQVWSRLSGELFSTGGRLDADPGDQVAPARPRGAAPGLLPLLSSLSSSACWLFTRQTTRLDQMGSVTRCYYGTDRVRFSSWPYRGKDGEESKVPRRRLKIAGTRREMTTSHRRLSPCHIDALALRRRRVFHYHCTSAPHWWRKAGLQAAARKSVNIISERVRSPYPPSLPFDRTCLPPRPFASSASAKLRSLEILTGVGLALGWCPLGWGRLNLVKSCLQRRETGTGG